MRSTATRPYRNRARRHLNALRPRSGRRQKKRGTCVPEGRVADKSVGSTCCSSVGRDPRYGCVGKAKPRRDPTHRRGCMQNLPFFTLPPVGTAKPGNDPARPNTWVASPPETCGRDARHGRPRIRAWQRRTNRRMAGPAYGAERGFPSFLMT
jgi:hypothetical protein